MTAQEFIAQCTVDGNKVIFPNIQLDRSTYNEVKSLLEKLNGSWVKSINGFVFEKPIGEYIQKVLDGEKINFNKQFQFFETPELVVEKIVDMAGVKSNFEGRILEPSAGRGAIIKGILAVSDCVVDVCETMPENIEILKTMNVNIVGEDYLNYTPSEKYDVIIANPPFTKNQDITHLQKMYGDLKSSGVIVCITSTHWKDSNNKVEKLFRKWLATKRHSVQELPANTFEKTAVKTLIVKIIKDLHDNDFGFYFYSSNIVEKQVKSEIYGETTAVGEINFVKENGYMPCGDGTDYKLTQRELKYIRSL